MNGLRWEKIRDSLAYQVRNRLAAADLNHELVIANLLPQLFQTPLILIINTSNLSIAVKLVLNFEVMDKDRCNSVLYPLDLDVAYANPASCPRHQDEHSQTAV